MAIRSFEEMKKANAADGGSIRLPPEEAAKLFDEFRRRGADEPEPKPVQESSAPAPVVEHAPLAERAPAEFADHSDPLVATGRFNVADVQARIEGEARRVAAEEQRKADVARPAQEVSDIFAESEKKEK